MKKNLVLNALLSTISFLYITEMVCLGVPTGFTKQWIIQDWQKYFFTQDIDSLETQYRANQIPPETVVNIVPPEVLVNIFTYLPARTLVILYTDLEQQSHKLDTLIKGSSRFRGYINPSRLEEKALIAQKMSAIQYVAGNRLAKKLHCTLASLQDGTCQPLKDNIDTSLTQEEPYTQLFKIIQAPGTKDWINLLQMYEEECKNKIQTPQRQIRLSRLIFTKPKPRTSLLLTKQKPRTSLLFTNQKQPTLSTPPSTFFDDEEAYHSIKPLSIYSITLPSIYWQNTY